ncbi:MAG: NIPSNAP family protein [Chitinophagaceae bacterium]|nr:NIPSNAP family protein [Chitinophagaceae bacterium]
MKHFKRYGVFVLAMLMISAAANCMPPDRQYYEIRIYQLSNADQEKRVDKYLKEALIPALHKNNIINIGVFKSLGNDTSAIRKTYVLIPYKSLEQFSSVPDKIEKDKDYLSAGSDYLDAPYNNPPYLRIEKILTHAFPKMPEMEPVKSTAPLSERVYELRSYESATEKLHAIKMKMFNYGDEVSLFRRLGFNAVFYSQAITGATMPNLFYMTTFENMAAHDKLWDSFKNDPEWKKLSAMSEYANSVSKANIYLLRPADYSDY